MPEGIGYGKNTRESKRQAFIESMRSKTKATPKAKAKPKSSKLRRRVKELIGGSKTYLPNQKKQRKTLIKTLASRANVKAISAEEKRVAAGGGRRLTTRTKAVKRGLRRSLTKQEIARFGGK